MKFLTPAAILALATVVSAIAPGPTQCDVKTSAIPPCATGCIEDAGTQFGCSKDNYWCQCEPDTYNKINGAAINCVLAECGIGKAGDVIAAANGVCDCASSYPTPTATQPPATVTPPPTTPTETELPGDPSQCATLTSAFPACASACIEAAGAVVGCAKDDYYCQCTEENFIAINLGAFDCVYPLCGESGTGAAIEAGMAVCECVSSYPQPGTTSSATSTGGPVKPTDITTSDVSSAVPTDVPTTKPSETAKPSCTQAAGPTECAASASAIPTCAKACIEDAGAQFGCSKDDYRCQCEPKTFAKINGAAINCVLGACGISGAIPVVEAANAVCECAAKYPATETCTAGPTSTGGPVKPTDVTTTTGPTTKPSGKPSGTATPSCTQVAGPTECAASASAIPTCAKSCIEDAGAQFGCSKDDYRCQCEPETFAMINGAAINCVLGACGISGAIPVVEAANAVCECAAKYPATETCTAGPTSTGGPVKPTDVTTTTGPTTKPSGKPSGTATPSCTQVAGPTECAASASATPTCAKSCIEDAGAQFGCSKDDYRCQCEPETFAKINGAAINCVLGACGISGAIPVVEAANAVCECAAKYPATETCTGGPKPTGTGGPVDPTDVTKTTGPTTKPSGTAAPSCTQAAGPTECAASASAIPTCAKSCIEEAGAEFGCSSTDYRCQCEPETFAKINGAALNCVLDACGITGALPVVEAANAVCDCAAKYPATETCTAGPKPTGTGGSGGGDGPTTSGTPGTPTSCSQAAGPTECATKASAIPACATPCIEEAGAQFGCSKTDYRCQCEPETYAKINGAALNCVLNACGIEGAPAVIEAANAVCECAEGFPAETCPGGPAPTGAPGGGSTKSTTLTYTVTSCPPAVTDCPIGDVVTTVVPCTTDEPEPTGGAGSGGEGGNGGGEGGSGGGEGGSGGGEGGNGGSGSATSSGSGSQTTPSGPAQYTPGSGAATLQPFMVAIAAMLVTVGVVAARQ